MNSRLFLPDSQASAVQFPPSCPVIFAEPAKRSSFDVDGSEAATASSNDKGMSVRLGKVTSVYIDISAGSNRELIYVVELPNPKKDASPSANTTRTTIDVPESSLRYAPNCPALFDLENLAVAAQDATSETPCGSTIMPALDTATAARGTILCGIPTILAGNLRAVSYSGLIYLEDGGLREYHNIPLGASGLIPHQLPTLEPSRLPLLPATFRPMSVALMPPSPTSYQSSRASTTTPMTTTRMVAVLRIQSAARF